MKLATFIAGFRHGDWFKRTRPACRRIDLCYSLLLLFCLFICCCYYCWCSCLSLLSADRMKTRRIFCFIFFDAAFVDSRSFIRSVHIFIYFLFAFVLLMLLLLGVCVCVCFFFSRFISPQNSFCIARASISFLHV